MTFCVLFVDSYDSFTYNVVELIKEQGEDIEVITIHNDTFQDYDEFKQYLRLFDAIVIGPGPGNPVNGPKDIGIIASLFDDSMVVPILGICLGFQVMCHVNGATVEQLHNVRHGQVYPIRVIDNGNGLYNQYPKTFDSVRYHSLHVVADSESSTIIPLSETLDDGKSVLMGGMIRGKPWYGVQYHPESCCSELGGKLIANFIQLAKDYNETRSDRKTNLVNNQTDKLQQHKQQKTDKETMYALSHKIDREPIIPKPAGNEDTRSKVNVEVESLNVTKDPKLTFQLCESLEQSDIPFFLMASSTINANRGEISIIALPSPKSKVFTHYSQINKTTIHNWRAEGLKIDQYYENLRSGHSDDLVSVLSENKNEFWDTIGTFMNDKRCPDQWADLPFIGGFVGILGYEMGQFTAVDVKEELKPNAKLCFVDNAILINHTKGELYTTGLDTGFSKKVRALIESALISKSDIDWPKALPQGISYDITLPARQAYEEAFEVSQQYLHQGDSYEVCLTTQTTIKPSEVIPPWRIFQTLIQKNPAPFSSFFQFDDIEKNKFDLCLISTSPERFLKYSNSSCELRPIKGTVKKGSGMDLEEATSILKTPKEFGENLMILDLIRNDLYELLPSVTVDEMMSVEEYETVYQLVSVVSGHNLKESKYSGLDVLKHSLPPGSMTGAPKKKTVELLQQSIEPLFGNSTRGVYSGVTGYWSANMNGDWSVNIRCMYSYDLGNTWQIGAGGAVTVLSDCDGEWKEMFTKLESALQVFNN
ncbi:unnamed protein product [Kluyveromyces dobzhanskii CBS 2104]|uniref:aminodeoxychorismate synthase n=1 Tax=Kluyveromyces dobzhanskii CBS 2104 TaxID=1427455 RepID=A0A0A8L214_9SACH|nr:unnamed protein product [Kluyveromyces dobzhanskii CBS 2104]